MDKFQNKKIRPNTKFGGCINMYFLFIILHPFSHPGNKFCEGQEVCGTSVQMSAVLSF